MKHKHVLWGLMGVVIGAMLVSGAEGRWPDTQTALLGNVGWLPFVVAVITLVFLAFNANIARRNLENTTAALTQARTAEVATRFQKGLELLQSSSAATRIGGIAVLRDVATQAPEQYWQSTSTVLKNLIEHTTGTLHEKISAATRNATEDHMQQWEPAPHFEKTSPDVLAALEVLALSNPALRSSVTDASLSSTITLQNVAFAHASFANLDLRQIQFSSAIFQNCHFLECVLEDCVLSFLSLGASFRACQMRGAMLDVRSAVWSGDTIELWACDASGSHIYVQGGAPLSLYETNTDDTQIVSRIVSLKACWHFGSPPRIPDDTEFYEHDIDVENVVGLKPISVGFGVPIYRLVSD